MTERPLARYLDDCYETARANGFYDETMGADLPPDRESLFSMMEEVIATGRLANYQRKQGETLGGAPADAHLTDAWFLTPRTVHIIRQGVHLADEIGEFLTAARDAELREFDLEELADVAIVLFDLACYLDRDRFIGALEAKMAINQLRPRLHGRPVTPETP